VRDISGSLARQSILVAGVCVACDIGVFLIVGTPCVGDWQLWTLLVMTVLVDAALAAPPQLSLLVSVGHAVALTVSPLLLPVTPGFHSTNNAGVLIAGYRAGAWLRTGQAIAALGVLMAGLTAARVLAGDRVIQDWRLLVLGALTSGLLPWLVGRYTTARRAYIADLEQRETEAVRRAVAEDRSAIARDLHDVISHHVSAIGMHAGAARLGLDDDQDGPVRRSLTAVETASRSAMADLRRLLDLLHGQHTDSAQRQPGLENLDELLEGMRAAGLRVRLVAHGKRVELPASLDIALYRIAQEALTNALRHGDGGAVEIELAYEAKEVALSIANAVAPHDRRAGDRHRGLAGIRHRVTLFGGHLSYGPDEGWWRIRATFPLEQTC
jgi:signal transduction histidine kinase